MFRAWLIGNIHDQPEMLAKLYEKVNPIFLKSILVKFSGLHTGLSELARYWFVAIRGVMGGKETTTFQMSQVGFE